MQPRYRSLTTGKTSRTAMKAAIRFLVDLWDYEPRAFTFIGTRRGDLSTAEQKSAMGRRKTRPSCYMPGGSGVRA